MKTHPRFRRSLAVIAFAAMALAAPAVRAQQPSPTPTPGSSDADIFDVIKKGADKLQKQVKETKEIEPKIKLLEERQNQLLKHQVELEKHLEAVLTKQADEIGKLMHTVEQLQTEMKACMAMPSPAESPKPAAPLPMTEPPVKATPTPTPSQS